MIDPEEGRVSPRAWMHTPGLVKILSALGGEDGQVRFVGGCVRDSIADRPIKDIDLATPLEPQKVAEKLTEAGVKVIPTGLKHGTVTAIAEGEVVEVTTLRVDLETFGRHAKVGFTDNWDEDAARRDFTINSMSLDPSGYLHDSFNGLEDLKAGRIRFVGSAKTRIEEDYLRILRLFRFHASYGREALDHETLAAVASSLSGLKALSGERVAAELLRLLEVANPTSSLEDMVATGVLGEVLPEAEGLDAIKRLIELEGRKGYRPDALSRLAVLISADVQKGTRVADRLRFSNALKERLLFLCEATSRLSEGVTSAQHISSKGLASGELRLLLHHHGKEDLALTLALAEALNPELDREAFVKISREIEGWQPRSLPVAGRDLLAIGFKPGPEVGACLRQLEVWWLAQDPAPSKEDCLSWLKERLQCG
ncbi:MAG: CCA tRNA nucleotidyltransferase [Kiloniellales bacterium]|nr:CCA tRNA nucleotidyltransferase [Kiloniellales bacterium]